MADPEHITGRGEHTVTGWLHPATRKWWTRGTLSSSTLKPVICAERWRGGKRCSTHLADGEAYTAVVRGGYSCLKISEARNAHIIRLVGWQREGVRPIIGLLTGDNCDSRISDRDVSLDLAGIEEARRGTAAAAFGRGPRGRTGRGADRARGHAAAKAGVTRGIGGVGSLPLGPRAAGVAKLLSERSGDRTCLKRWLPLFVGTVLGRRTAGTGGS